MPSITPVPAPPPGEPLDSARALVHSSTVECWVVISCESAMQPSLAFQDLTNTTVPPDTLAIPASKL